MGRIAAGVPIEAWQQTVADAAASQADANRAADDLAKGKANTPLEAATTQQKVAEQAAALAEQAKAALSS